MSACLTLNIHLSLHSCLVPQIPPHDDTWLTSLIRYVQWRMVTWAAEAGDPASASRVKACRSVLRSSIALLEWREIQTLDSHICRLHITFASHSLQQEQGPSWAIRPWAWPQQSWPRLAKTLAFPRFVQTPSGSLHHVFSRAPRPRIDCQFTFCG